MLTPAELDKIDLLNDQVITAIKDAAFTAKLEAFLRLQYAEFIGESVANYNASQPTGTCN